jgi:hypothetical protein
LATHQPVAVAIAPCFAFHREQGIAVLGMKPLAEGEIPRSGLVSAIECLHYALSLPTTVVMNGCESMAIFAQPPEKA